MKHTTFLILIILWSIRGFSQIPPYGDYAVKVDVVGNGFANTSLIYFEDDGWDPPATIPTYGWDACCDAQMLIGNANQPFIYTEVVDSPLPPGNTRLSINGLPHLFEPVDVLMGFLPGTLAQYNFKFTLLSTLPQGVVVELEDVAQNVTQDLLMDSVYTTWGAVSDDPERFIIHFYPANVTSLKDNLTGKTKQVEVFVNQGSITLSGLLESGAQEVLLFDIQGRIVWSEKITDGKSSLRVNSEAFSNGIYVFRIAMSDGSMSSQKIRI